MLWQRDETGGSARPSSWQACNCNLSDQMWQGETKRAFGRLGQERARG
jgi:hypothetical protein